MNLTARIITSLVIAAIAATIAAILLTGAMFEPLLLISFAVACVATALLGGNPTRENAGSAQHPQRQHATERAAHSGDEREYGKVKWFNVTKGFGFIIKDDGEEIFVHFRSIRGEGRRGLREGERVSFVTAESEKGPQAEDVTGED